MRALLPLIDSAMTTCGSKRQVNNTILYLRSCYKSNAYGEFTFLTTGQCRGLSVLFVFQTQYFDHLFHLYVYLLTSTALQLKIHNVQMLTDQSYLG